MDSICSVADSLAQHQKLHIHHREFPIAKKEKNLLKYPQVSKEDSDSNLLISAAAAVAAAPSSTCSDSVFEEGNSEESFKRNEGTYDRLCTIGG